MVHEALGHPGVVVGLKLSLFGAEPLNCASAYIRTEGLLKSATARSRAPGGPSTRKGPRSSGRAKPLKRVPEARRASTNKGPRSDGEPKAAKE